MATQASQTTPMIPQGRSLTAEEATEVQENLAPSQLRHEPR